MSGDGLGDFTRSVIARKKKALTAGAIILEAAWKEELSHPGSGRIYVVGRTLGRKRKDGTRGPGKVRTHQASAPGEAPAPDTNALTNSIRHEVGEDSARVGTNNVEAKPLEFGTTTAGKGHHTVIAPRPAARPALARSRDQIRAAMVLALRGEI